MASSPASSPLVRRLNILCVLALVAVSLYMYWSYNNQCKKNQQQQQQHVPSPSSFGAARAKLERDVKKVQQILAAVPPTDPMTISEEIDKLQESIMAAKLELGSILSGGGVINGGGSIIIMDMSTGGPDVQDDEDDDDDDDDRLEVVSISSNEIKNSFAGVVESDVIESDVIESPEVVVIESPEVVVEPPEVVVEPPEAVVESDIRMVEPVVVAPSKESTDEPELPPMPPSLIDDIQLTHRNSSTTEFKSVKLEKLKDIAQSKGIAIPKHASKASIIALLS